MNEKAGEDFKVAQWQSGEVHFDSYEIFSLILQHTFPL